MSDRSVVDDALLAQKLARLQELETDFEGAVERARLAALKEFAYGASHEINNPLANISTRAQALLADEPHPERRKKLATIVAQAFRAHEMISDLMLFAKPPPLELKQFRLKDVVEAIVSECQKEAEQQQVTLACKAQSPELRVRGDATQLGAAIKSLVRNALEALSEGGQIEIDVSQDDSTVIIAVSDDGPGIASHVREHLFDPFYSGREAGRGLGFGLPKCWRIAELHGGWMEVDSEPGAGTTMRIIVPRPCAG